MQARANRLRRCGGFTLVELLVVVAIIAVLVSILLPALWVARDQAKRVTCAARLQQWGIAFACYAAENRGKWPHCDGLDRGPRQLNHPRITKEDVADWHGWVDLLPRMIKQRRWRDHQRREFPTTDSFFQCPQGELVSGPVPYGYNPERNGYFSYAMNSCLELDSNAWPPPDGVGWPMPSYLDTCKIIAPPRVVLLFDQLLDTGRGFDGEAINRSAGKHCGAYPKEFSARHRGVTDKLGGNMLFCDGHVEWRPSVWQAEWDSDQRVPPRHDETWFPYPAAPGRWAHR